MRIGVDLGGTKIETLALRHDGEELWRQRVPTPAQQGADAIVTAVATLVAAAKAQVGLDPDAPVGIGTPGSLSPTTGRLRNSNTTCLNGIDLQRRFETALRAPVRIRNDANCFALSEAVDGAATGADVVFGVILGTGTGGGIVIGGEILTGRHAIAGEWGHNPLPWFADEDRPAPACYCGREGCLETYLSGPGLSADHRRHTGHDHDARAIVDAATDGDPDAGRTLARHRHRLARGLASIVNVLDPDVIVLGGGVSLIPGLAAEVADAMAPFVFTDSASPRVALAEHGDSSGVRGAARLWSTSAEGARSPRG
ncbi:MAG: ROK family protein [Myxococcota bacterium]